MPNHFTRFAAFVTLASISLFGTSERVRGQAYPIDCAILLCLSGGWPASAPCARARAEFIRRVTPWPVEPPLQIWRCPMGASFPGFGDDRTRKQVQDIRFDNGRSTQIPQSESVSWLRRSSMSVPAGSGNKVDKFMWLPENHALRLIQDHADIDISGPAFDFVRSVRVFHIPYARQFEAARDGTCRRGALVELGTYGTQGDFTWKPSSLGALPDAHLRPGGWGKNCPEIFFRSVFVEWRDYDGDYGFEQINY